MSATGSAARPAQEPAKAFVQVNCAISLDGRLAYAGGKRARFSGPEDLQRVQRLRADADAVLVGIGTVLRDDPSLRVHWDLLGEPAGRSPFRVVLDSQGRTPESARVLDGSQPTLIITAEGCGRRFPSHVETFAAGRDRVDLPSLLAYLGNRGVRRLLVEGGATVIAGFARARLIDRMTVFIAPLLIGGLTAPPLMAGPELDSESGAIRLRYVAVQSLGEGTLVTLEPAAESSRIPPPDRRGAAT